METASFLSHSVPVVAVVILAAYALNQRKGAVSTIATTSSVARFIAALIGVIFILFTIRLVRAPHTITDDNTPTVPVPAPVAPQAPPISPPLRISTSSI